MKKKVFELALVSILGIGLSGCGGNTPNIPVSLYKPAKQNIILTGAEKDTIPRNDFKVTSYYTKDHYLKDQIVIDTYHKQKIRMSKMKTNYTADLKPMVLGIANGNIIYVYTEGLFDQKDFLEVYDTKNNKRYTLLTNNNKIQLLKNGSQIVLKVFTDPSVQKEKIVWGLVRGKPTTDSMHSKYTNKKAYYISLNSLKEVTGISNNFKNIILYNSFTNISNRQTQTAFITYDVAEITGAFTKNIKKRHLKPLF